jgi:ketosteroid isomerase-like protein
MDLYRGFATRDLKKLRTLLSDQIEWRQSPGFPGGEVRIGVEAVLSGIVGVFERDWQGWRFHAVSFLEAGDTVVVLGAYRAQNRSTGKSVDSETVHVFDLKAGRVIRFRQYSDTKAIWDAMA